MALADQCRLWIDGLNVPSASAHALDADVILAASAAMISQPGDQVIVATPAPWRTRALGPSLAYTGSAAVEYCA